MAFRVLIVANGFVQGAPDSFPPDVRSLFEQDHEVRVMVPTRTGRLAWLTSDTGPATGEASALVSEILADIRRKGIEHPPSGHVGDENQLLAIKDALAQFRCGRHRRGGARAGTGQLARATRDRACPREVGGSRLRGPDYRRGGGDLATVQ
jgi:hypothetical protein